VDGEFAGSGRCPASSHRSHTAGERASQIPGVDVDLERELAFELVRRRPDLAVLVTSG
jgi:hypothetical protein